MNKELQFFQDNFEKNKKENENLKLLINEKDSLYWKLEGNI